jgi:hypothetical protein
MSSLEQNGLSNDNNALSWEIRRRTGAYRAMPYSESDVTAWVNAIGLPPKLQGETWPEWAERTGEERHLGSLSLHQTVEQSAEEDNGN